MEPQTVTEAAVVATTTLGLPGYDIFTPIMSWAFGSTDGVTGIFSVLQSIWSIYAALAYIFAALFLGIYVYATVSKGQLEEMQEELIHHAEEVYDEHFRTGPKSDRLGDIFKHIASDNPNDWKLAIIEADIMLDDGLKKAGYMGNSLGERLRGISPSQMESLDDAWEAHKVRNQIAHAGADFVLTKRLAEDTLKQYRRVFAELDIA